MRKDPFDFDVADWMNDPAVCLLRPSTRAIWFDALCHMHNLGRTGELSGSMLELAKLCRCTPVEMREAVDELKRRGCADVTERHKIVTLINRRMKREAEARKAWRDRKKRQREKIGVDDVTQMSRRVSRKCHTKNSVGPPDGFPPLKHPSSFPPEQTNSGADSAGENGDGDVLDREIRAYIGSHRMLEWHLKAHAAMRKLVNAEGWPRAKELVDRAVERGMSFPIPYALGIAQKESKSKAASGENGHKPRERSAVAAPGREDN